MPGSAAGHSRRRARGARNMSRSTSAAEDPPVSPQPSRGASDLYQDAQNATAELKGLLKTQPPWTKEADALRQRTRNALLAILFQHPLHPHGQSIEPLWLNTTYTLISAYRDVVARIEAALPTPSSRRGGNAASKHASGGDAAGDLRRTLSRFRSALGAEDTFYRSLIARIVGFYRLQDRTGAQLALVGIPVPSAGAADEHDPSLAPPSISSEETEKKVGLVYKGLICLGDLERYKEQYSDKSRRDAREQRERNTAAPQARDLSDRFSRAILYYEVARGLQPDNGMAFNQLAVIDGYLNDNFHCVYHYFRALAVRQPFPNGEANLDRVLKKIFDRWRSTRYEEDDTSKDNSEAFQRQLLTVVSVLFVKAGTSHFAPVRATSLELFGRLLRARQLPSEGIVKTTVMAIGSHWHARLGVTGHGRAESQGDLLDKHRVIEDLALSFLLAVFTTLIVVSADEVEDVLASTQDTEDSALATDDDPIVEGENDGTLVLAQRITAVVRRILPSLRIMSRWIKAHLEYLARASSSKNPELQDTVASFWGEYKRLILALARLFPLPQLPELDEPLEEDMDMRGFLPLRRGLTAGTHTEELNFDDATRQNVHPNEEQLMRIADLLVDVKLLMQSEAGAEALSTGAPLPSAPFVAQRNAADAASVSFSTETEDDPVNMAMRATLGEGSSVGGDEQDMDDDDEVILWGRHTPVVHSAPSTGPTAQDLLQKLTLAQTQSHGPANQPLLFGGDLSGSGSIWTMSREESQKGTQRASLPAQTQPIASIWTNDRPVPPGSHPGTHPLPSHSGPHVQHGPQALPQHAGGNASWPHTPQHMPPPPPGLGPPGFGPPGLANAPPGLGAANWSTAPPVLSAQLKNGHGQQPLSMWGAADRNTWGPAQGQQPQGRVPSAQWGYQPQ